MQWIQLLEIEQSNQPKQLKILKKWKKFTLYDHNSYVNINQNDLTFTCIFNSKKINNQHTIIGKIFGCFKTNQITISNTLTDCQVLLGGKWQYQKVQLTRFAFRYNERSNNNILIKVNPVNGQVAVCVNFLIQHSIFEDEQNFKSIITDACQVLGEEAEKIFNTMMEIIYQRQANEPYLKSGIKINPNFPRYMKAEKLLDKVKSLIATSSHYKIKVDTSSAHKNRSYFKKLYLLNEKKYIKDEQIQKLALLYQLKYNKVYEDPVRKMRDKLKDFIKDYTEIEQKNQIQFAKHLNQSQKYTQRSNIKINIRKLEDPEHKYQYEHSEMRKILKTNNKDKFKVLIDQFDGENLYEKSNHTMEILQKIWFLHPNITKYYFDQKNKNLRITEGYKSLFLQDFLNKNKKTISLSTKFDIMSQVCHALQFMHKRFVGCFLRLQDIIIDKGLIAKVRNLSYTYRINEQVGWKQFNKNSNQSNIDFNSILRLQVEYIHKLIEFPYINIMNSQVDRMQTKDIKKILMNQKCDIYSLGIVLYRIMMDKYPFFSESVKREIEQMSHEEYNSFWMKLWTLETEYFLSQGGPITKLVAHLLLKCFNTQQIKSRPYVQWMTVILSEIKTSLNGLY